MNQIDQTRLLEIFATMIVDRAEQGLRIAIGQNDCPGSAEESHFDAAMTDLNAPAKNLLELYGVHGDLFAELSEQASAGNTGLAALFRDLGTAVGDRNLELGFDEQSSQRRSDFVYPVV